MGILEKIHRKKTLVKLQILLILYMLSYSICMVDFPKNNNILESEKSVEPRIEYMSDLEEIEKRIFEKKENTIILFYADWCHHCKEFLPNFEEASKYKLANGFTFMKVNCQNKNICNHFDVKHYPTIKIFIEGHKSSEEPGREIASLLEFILKSTTPAIIELHSENEIKDFKIQYGENSFVVNYDGNKNSDFYKCIENLAEKKFKQNFYFGLYDEKTKSEGIKEKIQHNKIIYNEKYGIEHEWTGSCLEIENFIENNLFPIIRKLDSNFIKKVQKENKKLVMSAVSIKNSVHMYFLENVLAAISVQNRKKDAKYVFAFIDVDLDSYLINYFKIELNNLPKIIIYDFEDKRYYVDDNQDTAIYANEESSMKHLAELIEKAETPGALAWTTGNFFEDLLAKLGIRLNQSGIIFLVGGLFAILAISFLIMIFYCGDKHEEEEAKKLEEEFVKRQKEEKEAANNNSDSKNNPLDKKNQ